VGDLKELFLGPLELPAALPVRPQVAERWEPKLRIEFVYRKPGEPRELSELVGQAKANSDSVSV